MSDMERALDEAIERWDSWGWARPAALLVSGSGLAVDLLPDLAGETRPLADLLPFEIESVVGHPLSIQVLGAETGWPVLYQRGRLHSYQGHSAFETVFMVRLAALMGAGTVIQTNAAGSLRRDVSPGDLVVLRDHINLIGMNPLRGTLPEAWGPRFPDMSSAYTPVLRQRLLDFAADQGVELHQGVYVAVAGPSYETPAEVRMLGGMGADVVGMSTVMEVIAGAHMGLENLAISMVSNHAAGISDSPLDHNEVLEAALSSSARLIGLLEALLSDRMG